MSPKQPRGYQPTQAPEPAKLNLDEIERIKKMFEDSKLAKYIIMAGVTGVILATIEIGRVVADLVHYCHR